MRVLISITHFFISLSFSRMNITRVITYRRIWESRVEILIKNFELSRAAAYGNKEIYFYIRDRYRN